jgi:hypothetical protein
MERPELYEIESDIGEKYDRYESEPEIVAELMQKIEQHLEDTKDGMPDQLEARIKK